MNNLAGGTLFLGTTALLAGFLFYFQPTVEAVTFANISQKDLIEFNQETIQNQQSNQSDLQQNQQNQTAPQIQQPQVSEPAVNSEPINSLVLEASAYRATAYCLKGRTAMGGGVRRGIVAADPRVLPLGTQIQLDAGSYSGTYTVADTGGAVRGRKLDIWVPSCSEANRFGRRTVMVSRLGKNRKS